VVTLLRSRLPETDHLHTLRMTIPLDQIFPTLLDPSMHLRKISMTEIIDRPHWGFIWNVNFESRLRYLLFCDVMTIEVPWTIS
jgi:hypothetical protein